MMVVTPVLRDVFTRFDYMRCAIGSKLWAGAERDLFNQRFSVSDTTLTDVPGLKGDKAYIRRDISTGIVTLSARSAVDTVFAQGYAHALDRLYQLDMSRRKAKGTVSEVLGEHYLGWDKVSRVANIYTLAKRDWQRLSDAAEAETKGKNSKTGESYRRQVALLTSYAAGINAYLQQKAVMPIEFYLYYGSMRRFFTNWGEAPEMEPWNPVDSLAIFRMFAFESGQGWEAEYLKAVLVESVGAEAAALLLPPASVKPTVIDGDITWLQSTTGMAWAATSGDKNALLGSDLQSPMESHNRWYQNELKWAQFGSNTFATVVAGASLPGVPLIMQGRNDHIAWGWAVADTDSEDLFVEELVTGTEGGTDAVLAKGERESVAVRVEKIAYSDKHGEKRRLEMRVVETRHGPVINDIIQASFPGLSKKYNVPGMSFGESSDALTPSLRHANLSLSSQALLQPLDLSFPLHLSTARGWSDFNTACQSLSAMALHVVYADRRGNTGYATTGARVERHKEADGSLPTVGSGQRDWKTHGANNDKKKQKQKQTQQSNRLLNSGQSVFAVTEDAALPASALMAVLLTGGGMSHSDALARALLAMNDVHSPSSMQLAAIMGSHRHFPTVLLSPGGEGASGLLRENEEKIERVRAALKATDGGAFDGMYTEEAGAALALVEAFRQAAAEKALGSGLLPLQGYLRGAPITAGFSRDSRSTALLRGHAWLLRLLQDSDDDDVGAGASATVTERRSAGEQESWLDSRGTGVNTVVREALLAVATWMNKADRDRGATSTFSTGNWGIHHLTSNTHFIHRHSIQHAAMSPPPRPSPGGAEDSLFRAPYAIRSESFHIHSRGSPQYSKQGGKGEIVMPFYCCGAGQFMSSLRLASDLALSLSGDSGGLWWSAGSSLVYHSQTRPDNAFFGIFSGSFSLATEVLTKAISWGYSMLFRRGGGLSGNTRTPTEATDANPAPKSRAGPVPWAVKIQTGDDDGDGVGGASVVRLLKSGKASAHSAGDEL